MLTGEAFFEVAQDAAHPFIIHSGGVTTRVLGTSFNVKSYPGQSDIRVMVVSGKVAVSDSAGNSSGIELNASQMALFDKKANTWSKIKTNETAAIEERKSGRFLYKSELLITIAADMEQYFGIRIKVGDALKSCKVFADFRLSDRKEEILQLIALMVNARLTSKDGVFLLTGKGCQ
jgi:ferric-dicitrate binding protein FerR (iron transport regulator)